MADLGWDVAKLVRLAYLMSNGSTRKVIGVNAFLDVLPGPALELKLHVNGVGQRICRKQWPMPLKLTP